MLRSSAKKTSYITKNFNLFKYLIDRSRAPLTLSLAALVPAFAFAQTRIPENQLIAQRACFRQILAEPVDRAFDRSITSGLALSSRPALPLRTLSNQAAQIRINGRNYSVTEMLYNNEYPALRIDAPGESNSLLVVDAKVPFFSWDQAREYGCRGLALPGDDPNLWQFPVRTRRDLLQVIARSTHSGGLFLTSLGSIPRTDGRGQENFHALFVQEETEAATARCYQGGLTAYMFSPSFFMNTLWRFTDSAQQDRADLLGSNNRVLSPLESQSVGILLRFAYDRPVMPDAQMNRSLFDHLRQFITETQKRQIVQAYERAGGANNTSAGESAVAELLRNQGIDWTRVYNDPVFQRELRDRITLENNHQRIAQIDRDQRSGGGVPVICVTEIPRSTATPRALQRRR